MPLDPLNLTHILIFMSEKRLAGTWAASSNPETPEEISNRVKGIVLALSSVIILVAAQFFHITLSASDVITLAGELGAVAGAAMTIYGAGLWLVRTIASKRI